MFWSSSWPSFLSQSSFNPVQRAGQIVPVQRPGQIVPVQRPDQIVPVQRPIRLFLFSVQGPYSRIVFMKLACETQCFSNRKSHTKIIRAGSRIGPLVKLFLFSVLMDIILVSSAISPECVIRLLISGISSRPIQAIAMPLAVRKASLTACFNSSYFGTASPLDVAVFAIALYIASTNTVFRMDNFLLLPGHVNLWLKASSRDSFKIGLMFCSVGIQSTTQQYRTLHRWAFQMLRTAPCFQLEGSLVSTEYRYIFFESFVPSASLRCGPVFYVSVSCNFSARRCPSIPPNLWHPQVLLALCCW